MKRIKKTLRKNVRNIKELPVKIELKGARLSEHACVGGLRIPPPTMKGALKAN